MVFYYSGRGVPDTNGDIFLSSSELNPDAPFRNGLFVVSVMKTTKNVSQ
jgi:hypothetical protein